MKKDVKDKDRKRFWRIATIAIGAILVASVGIVWIGGAIEGEWAPPVSTCAGSSGQDIPHLLNYQGVLTDSAGDPVPNDTYQMTFGIYDSATGGNLPWSETQNVQVSEGLFNVLIGSVNPISADVFCGGADRWIGLKVETDAEMTPRQRIVSVAYAYAAECAQGITPGHGLVIEDIDGNVAHQLNTDGTSWHAGMQTFDGGIEITGPHESPHWTITITAEGGEKSYDESGTLRYERGADGSENTYHDDGTLSCEIGADGSIKYYHGDTVSYEKLPDGSEKFYHDDGTLEYETDANGNEKNYYEDGTLMNEVGADSSCKTYYEDSTLMNERGADGSGKSYYEEGTLEYEWGADGSFKTYYEDGTPNYEMGADGSEKWYDEDGELTCEVKADGDSSQTGTHTSKGTSGGESTIVSPSGVETTNDAGDVTTSTSSESGGLWTIGDGWFGGDTGCGGTKSAVVETTNYGNRTIYCEEAAEVYFFDRGESQLENGEITVELDPIFLETVTINATYPMLVQLTLTGDCNGVFVAQRTASNFTVKELRGGNANAGFMWEAAAKRKGYEDTRLEEWSK